MPTPANTAIPAELAERLSKADGHINATERRLWNETERGIWSAHQAVARIAEIWLRFHGHLADLPPVGKYLDREVMKARIADFTKRMKGAPLVDAWRELKAAEAAIEAEPFISPPAETQETLHAGLERQRHYLNALRGLTGAVEAELAARYIALKRGDWVHLPNGHIGYLFHMKGLHCHALLPGMAMRGLHQACVRYYLGGTRIEAVEPPPGPPIALPAYYWLVEASRRWRINSDFLEAGQFTLSDFYRLAGAMLSAAAKAWWFVFEPETNRVSWENDYWYQDVGDLADKAPDAIAHPLGKAVQRLNDLHRKGIAEWTPHDLAREGKAILQLAREGISALEHMFLPRVDLTVGDWVEIDEGVIGRIAMRDGARLTVDLGRNGVCTAALFHSGIQRVGAPHEFAEATDPAHHRRWLWYAGHPNACLDRDPCPCCGLPGVEPAESGCHLCGWRHDGGDFDPERPSGRHPNLDLALGRRRFHALGYAAAPEGIPEFQQAWLHPLALAQRRLLVDALTRLAEEDAADDDSRLAGISALWRGPERGER